MNISMRVQHLSNFITDDYFTQITYLDGPTIMHGTDMGNASLPTASVNLERCEQLVGILGTSDSLVYSIGFNTSEGRVYGPWGSPLGKPFTYPGAVFGFFGAERWGCIAAIGVWVADLATLFDSLPPPSPVPPPPPTRGMSKSPVFGGNDGLNTPWDDGPSHEGSPSYKYRQRTAKWSPRGCV
jgi:hypothetical protein